MHKKTLVAIPPALLEQVDYVANAESRTRSDLIREALRRYINDYSLTHGNKTVFDSVIQRAKNVVNQ